MNQPTCCEKLREALRPFKDLADKFDVEPYNKDWPDEMKLRDSATIAHHNFLTLGDCRRAKAALSAPCSPSDPLPWMKFGGKAGTREYAEQTVAWLNKTFAPEKYVLANKDEWWFADLAPSEPDATEQEIAREIAQKFINENWAHLCGVLAPFEDRLTDCVLSALRRRSASRCDKKLEEIVRECVDEVRDKAVRLDGYWPMDATPVIRKAVLDASASRDRKMALCGQVPITETLGFRDQIAEIQAHRACHSAEHDPANGNIHGYCIVCGVPFPCDYVGKPSRDLEMEELRAWAKKCEQSQAAWQANHAAELKHSDELQHRLESAQKELNERK